MLRLGYAEWHMNLVLTLEETYSFFRMVSMFYIVEYGADISANKLKVEADLRPSVLLNRLQVKICGKGDNEEMEYEDMTDLLKTIQKIYSAHITGMHHVLPTRSDPPELLRCVAMTRMTLSPGLAGQIGRTSTRDILPMVATQLSGIIQVKTKRRGVTVAIDYEKRQQFLDGPPKPYKEII
jgi:hypothetical protein